MNYQEKEYLMKISDKGSNFATDYKPFYTEMHYTEYAKYGFCKGQKDFIREIQKEVSELLADCEEHEVYKALTYPMVIEAIKNQIIGNRK